MSSTSGPWIDAAMLDGLCALAGSSPRLRRNLNFHGGDADACQRMLNALEPASYIQPHRHMGADKEETLLVLRGAVGLLFFDDDGLVVDRAVLAPGSACMGVNVAPGRFHSVFALHPGTVFFESKAGPYAPLVPAERAPWAPPENDPGVGAYMTFMRSQFPLPKDGVSCFNQIAAKRTGSGLRFRIAAQAGDPKTQT